MHSRMATFIRPGAWLLAFSCFAAATLAKAPLICHRFDIGGARSLPWISQNWNLTGSESYDTKNLSSDTLSILDSSPVVLVHMETVRRATLYAQKDAGASTELLTRLMARADSSGSSSHPNALAIFDLGYLAEAYQPWLGESASNPAAGIDGYALVNQALALRGADPQMEFAAALMALGRPASEHQAHAQKAMAEAKGDVLLAGNLSCRFLGPESQTVTMAEMISRSPALTVHEWGTFTSVAGTDGGAVRWVALNGPSELPGFVEHLSGAYLKFGLRGTVRMETPVLYFYTTRETNVSVRVEFSKGLITEWYPHASRVEPRGALTAVSLNQNQSAGSIAWPSVTVEPGVSAALPSEESDRHYYAARQTSAAPLVVRSPNGQQNEKFLFYRGVSAISVPLAAKVSSDGGVEVVNLAAEEIPNLIFFERRGHQVGYRIIGPFGSQVVLAPLELTDSVESLCSDLEGILAARGLFADEAHAMVETWKDSWFEEGARLFYIVPRKFLDSVLPLSITPVPVNTVRAFVGRIELVTPATERAVESALARNDRTTLAQYGRFLEPILATMIQQSSDGNRAAQLRRYRTSLRPALFSGRN